MSSVNFKLIKPIPTLVLIGCALLPLLLCSAGAEPEKGNPSGRFFPGLFGPRPLPGDIVSPIICERFCRDRCLSGGFSGFLNVPGCNQFCDCLYYRPYY